MSTGSGSAKASNDDKASESDGADQVWGLISTLVAGPAVWGAVGYGVDRAADTSVWTPAGVVLGFVTSFYVVWTKTR
jgi:F0F1-type ATP synthase assembly protein I